MNGSNERIYKLLLDRIESGAYPPGSKMPPERELAKELGVTHWNVHMTMDELAENGFVQRLRAIGTFVSKNIAMDQIRRRKNSYSKLVTITVARNFYYIKHGYEDIIGSMERRLEEKGFTVVYEDMPENRGELERFLEGCASSGVKALAVFPEQREWDILHQHRDTFLKYPIELYYYNRGLGPIGTLPFNCVGVDMYQSGCAAANWVIQKNFDNIAFICGDNFECHWLDSRYSGFKEQLAAYNKKHRLMSSKGVEQIIKQVLRFVQESKTPPALAVSTDEWAVAIYDSLGANDLTACRDFHMLSFDDLPAYRNYKLANIAWPLDKVGTILADAIDSPAMSKKHDIFTVKYQLKPIIIERFAKE